MNQFNKQDRHDSRFPTAVTPHWLIGKESGVERKSVQFSFILEHKRKLIMAKASSNGDWVLKHIEILIVSAKDSHNTLQ